MVDLYHTFWIRPWPCCLPPKNILSDQKERQRQRCRQDGVNDVIYNTREKHKIWRNTRNSTRPNCLRTQCSCPTVTLYNFPLSCISSLFIKWWHISQPISLSSPETVPYFAENSQCTVLKCANYVNKWMTISNNTKSALSISILPQFHG